MIVSLCVFAAGAFAAFFLWGRQANIYEGLAEGCGGPQGVERSVVLRHLDAFLSVECGGTPPR